MKQSHLVNNMKSFVFILCAFVAALDAQPFGYGAFGTGLGLGLGRYGGQQSQYANGRGYGGEQYANGVSGIRRQGYQNSGMGGYHNIGGHHNKVTSINQAEDSGFHNIGGGSAMNNGGYADGAYNGYQNGRSQFGNGFNAGSQGIIA